jgi:hypothetical protein
MHNASEDLFHGLLGKTDYIESLKRSTIWSFPISLER